MSLKIDPKKYLELKRDLAIDPVKTLLGIIEDITTDSRVEIEKINTELAHAMSAFSDFAESSQDELKVLEAKYEVKITNIIAEADTKIAQLKALIKADSEIEAISGTHFEKNLARMVAEVRQLVKDGATGSRGEDGKTPKAGVDYPTNAQIKATVDSLVTEQLADAVIKIQSSIRAPKKGVDYFTPVDVDLIIKKLQKTFPKLETGESIVNKINALPITPAKQIDVSHIKGWKKFIEPKKGGGRMGRGTGSAVQYADLSSQCNGVLKVFVIPTNSRVLAVFGTQFPVVFRPLVDWTATTSALTLTSQVGAPETGQSLFILYVE